MKRVHFLSPELLVSASADRSVKVWDLRKATEAVSSVSLANPVEDFCMAKNELYVAHANTISMVSIQDSKLEQAGDFTLFQKPIIKISYDPVRERVLAGGLDSMLKFLEPIENEGSRSLKVAHKIKLPSEVFSMDMSRDGNHYAMGLNDGSLVIKSKYLEAPDDGLDHQERLFA